MFGVGLWVVEHPEASNGRTITKPRRRPNGDKHSKLGLIINLPFLASDLDFPERLGRPYHGVRVKPGRARGTGASLRGLG